MYYFLFFVTLRVVGDADPTILHLLFCHSERSEESFKTGRQGADPYSVSFEVDNASLLERGGTVLAVTEG